MMWGWGYGGYGAPWGWVGPVIMAVFWIAAIVGIVFLVRSFIRKGRQSGREVSALEILQGRYAKGEIGKEEYEEKRRDLS